MVICVDPSVPVIVPTSPVTPSTVGVSDAEVDALRAAGVELQTFDLPGDVTWTDGVLSDGEMRAAWFADPDGNVLNVETHPADAAG